MKDQSLFEFLSLLKWIVVPCLPLNIIGFFYVLMYIEDATFFSIQLLVGTMIGVGLGIFLLVKWKYYTLHNSKSVEGKS